MRSRPSGQLTSSPNWNLSGKTFKTRDAPDTVFAGYPANPKARYRIRAGYRISGRIFGNYI
jgi:hypothetical protein